MKSRELCRTLERALGKFRQALAFEDTEPLRESLIQRFEYTFELSSKVMSSVLADEGVSLFGVRTVIRTAAKAGLVADPSRWLIYSDARNKTSQLYKEDVALEVALTARSGFDEDVAALLLRALERVDADDSQPPLGDSGSGDRS